MPHDPDSGEQVNVPMYPRTVAALCVAFPFLLVAGCGEREVEVKLEEAAKAAFVELPGKIGIRVKTLEEEHLYILRNGELSPTSSLPRSPIKASAIGAGFTVEINLPANEKYRYHPPYLISPDKRLVAVALRQKPETISWSTALVIVDLETKKTAALIEGDKAWAIEALAWSPDSRLLSVLRGPSRPGMGPLEIIAGFSGHAVLYSNYYLEVLDFRGNEIASSELASDVRASWGEIVWLED